MDDGQGEVSWRALFQSALPNIYVGVAVSALLGVAAYLGWAILHDKTGNPTFNFIGIVIIFMAALTVAATIFVGLKLANPLEAFGLPTGSMRALLAIGIMILFVVFGLPMISATPSEVVAAQRGEVAPEKLQETIRFHQDQGLKVRIISDGTPAVPATATTPAQPGAKAVFETFGHVDLRSPETIDFGKQILTAVITLLTSVVSFYFGSRSATEGQRGSDTEPAAPADLAALRKQLDSSRTALDPDWATAAARVETLTKDPTTATNTPRTTALTEAEALRAEAAKQRDALDKVLADADAALASLASATSAEDRKRYEATARAQLGQAAPLLKAAQKAQTAYTDKVKAIP
jgi:hypothetical protein